MTTRDWKIKYDCSDNCPAGQFVCGVNCPEMTNVEAVESNCNRNRDIDFLLNFVPKWARIVPKGLDSIFYGTFTYSGDLEIKEKVDKIKRRYKQG